MPYVAEYLAHHRSLRPQRSIWQPAFDPALSCPDSLCVHNYFDLRFYGLRYEIVGLIIKAAFGHVKNF